MNEAVDVILPTHRRPHTVEFSIRSVLQQSYPHFRLHVIGDGCDDATDAAVSAVNDPRLSFYRFPKASGFGYAHRNKILRETSGRYIAYATDDDLWFPDHLERALMHLENENLGMVTFRYCHVDFPDRLDPHFFAMDWRLGAFSRFLRNWFMGAVSCVHDRRVLDEVGYWDDTLPRFGDRDFYRRVRMSPVPCAYLDDITVMRFFALHWDSKYRRVNEPPQGRYVKRLKDAGWCQELRERAAFGRKGVAVRCRQACDFIRFAVNSGPRFLRFCRDKALQTIWP